MTHLRERGDSVQARLLRALEAGPDNPAIAFVDSRGAFQWQTTQRLFDDEIGRAHV